MVGTQSDPEAAFMSGGGDGFLGQPEPMVTTVGTVRRRVAGAAGVQVVLSDDETATASDPLGMLLELLVTPRRYSEVVAWLRERNGDESVLEFLVNARRVVVAPAGTALDTLSGFRGFRVVKTTGHPMVSLDVWAPASGCDYPSVVHAAAQMLGMTAQETAELALTVLHLFLKGSYVRIEDVAR